LDWVQKNPDAWALLQELSGKIPEVIMIDLNSQVDVDKKSFSDVARGFLSLEKQSKYKEVFQSQLTLALEHLYLVFVPVLFAVLFGVPAGYLAYRIPSTHTFLASFTTIFQTIPALAFLTLLIPLTGIGTNSALIVLFVYALLPIFINSYEGFCSVSKLIHLSCDTIKVKSWFKFRWIEQPLAMPQIFAGIQTALITTVATATLAALIGAGGYGKKIIAGLAVNDLRVVLEGSIPCIVMALLIQFACHWISKSLQRQIRN